MTTGMEVERHEIEKQKARALNKIAEELHRLRLLKERESGYSSEDKVDDF
jgi:hypothetical protein